ncbi:unnamed protein product [Allacma fusca]|uniref:Uncharacterized protein n=1 Tax=Allacma fusca TaxID=39272 RepID=A0A8J2KY38_9HEXA|nr:unnamed protein product [Allacma fusca]
MLHSDWLTSSQKQNPTRILQSCCTNDRRQSFSGGTFHHVGCSKCAIFLMQRCSDYSSRQCNEIKLYCVLNMGFKAAKRPFSG